MIKLRIVQCSLLHLLIITVINGLLLVACNGSSSVSSPVPETMAPIQPTLTPADTPTPTPVPGKVVLVVPPEADQNLVQGIQAELEALAGSTDQQMEVRPAIQAGEIGLDWTIVVLLSPPADLSELITAAPQTQFLVISRADLVLTDNLSLIRTRPEMQAFMAGYIATIIASDWRSAALLPADEPFGALMVDAFKNGGRYLCGRCNPLYGPVVQFPLAIALPSNSDTSSWQYAAEELEKNLIYVMYMTPEASSPELLIYLAGKGIILLGGQAPPEEVRPLWAATISQDVTSSLRELLPELLAGQGGRAADAAIQISDVHPELFSPGKQLMVEKVMQKLLAGWIYPLSVPVQ